MGKDKIKSLTPEQHHPLIDYCHKMKRREENEKKLLLAELEERKDLIEQEQDKNRLKEGERDSYKADSDEEDASDSEEDEDEQDQQNDKNIDREHDIPMVRNLKVVKPDPEEEDPEEDEEGKKKKLKAKRGAQIDKMMEVNDHEFDTHFHDNPVLLVKKRQEQRKKLLEQKKKGDKGYEEVNDLYYESKSRKFYVKDLEKVERVKKQAEKRKKEERDDYLEKMLPKEMKHLIDIEDKVRTSHKRRRIGDEDEEVTDMKGIQLPGRSKSRGKSRIADGHFVKKSKDHYKGKDGKSDVLRPGELEPYAYIQFNPQMINKRYRDRAVKTFGSVVEKKKADKRKTK